ncbi:MAG: hypothetical protein CMJ23_12880, partial [Phycisphaerae bacterium]|nr:hypothetical protein [Phycisphaerae bacterium]
MRRLAVDRDSPARSGAVRSGGLRLPAVETKDHRKANSITASGSGSPESASVHNLQDIRPSGMHGLSFPKPRKETMHHFKTRFTTLILIGFLSAGAVADTISVCHSGCDQNDLQQAIDIAADGDVIVLEDQTTAVSNIIIPGKILTIEASFGQTAILDAEGGGRIISIAPDSEVFFRRIEFR